MKPQTSRFRRVMVAGAQFAAAPNNIEANLKRCVQFLERAAREKRARLLVFPESITTGFNPGMSAGEFYRFLPPVEKILLPIQEACRRYRIHCVLPTYEKGRRAGVIYNSAFVIDENGRNLGAYRKTHPFPTERLGGGGWTTPGSRYPVFPTSIGVLGLHICYDGDFPEVARILAVKGAQILCRPSALLRHYEIWESTNQMRAYENHVYHIAVNAVGSDAAGTTYFGHSIIVSPIAQTLALGHAGEDLVYAELDPDPIKRITFGADAPMLFDHLEDRNVKSYTKELFTPARSAFEPARRISMRQ